MQVTEGIADPYADQSQRTEVNLRSKVEKQLVVIVLLEEIHTAVQSLNGTLTVPRSGSGCCLHPAGPLQDQYRRDRRARK
jgi:hypothetical protein